MTFLMADLRYALRTLRNSPGFVCVALLSLALGIGANTAIFNLIDSILLKSLPVRNPKELRIVGIMNQRGEKDSFSYPLYERVRDGNRVFSGVFAAASGVMVAEVIGPLSNARIENARVQLVTGEFFDVLGVNAFAGRLITPADNSSGSPNPMAVVSYRFWKQNLGQDYSVLGKNIKLNGRTLTIAGISAPEFFGDSVGEAPDFWTPAALQPLFDRGFSRLGRANHGWLRMIGRLRPGLNTSQARAAMGVLLAQIKSGNDGVARSMRNVVRLDLEPGDKGVSFLRVRYSQPLHIVMAIVASLLLIACANIGNLLLARSSVRQAEIAIRLAVGASRWHVARQMLTESILLASAGGVLGILFAYWGAHVVLNLVSGGAGGGRREVRYSCSWLHNRDLPGDRIAVRAYAHASGVPTGCQFGIEHHVRRPKHIPLEDCVFPPSHNHADCDFADADDRRRPLCAHPHQSPLIGLGLQTTTCDSDSYLTGSQRLQI